MKEYTLSQRYAMIGLDGTDSLHMSMRKSAVIRAIAAAKILEEISDWTDEILKERFNRVKNLKKKEMRQIENEMTVFLEREGILEKAPDLFSCDMYNYTAGVEFKIYRSDKDTYLRIIEEVRAEILEDGPVSEESVFLLWLCRESGCIYDIFAAKEQEEVECRMTEVTASNESYRSLWEMEIHSGLESMSEKFLRAKRNLFKNPYMEGVNLLYPFLDRRQAIFVDFVIFGTSVQERRVQMMTFLSERGHYVEEVKRGNETLLKVDNAFYRVFPKTISVKGVPIQGAQLLPVY